MRLDSVSFENFKSFRDEVTIPLKQITCLIGPNSAGKSNILHGLKTISTIIAGGNYAAEPRDYFDNDTSRKIKLTAVMELSDDERKAIAARIRNKSAALLHDTLGDWLFKRLKYEISLENASMTHTISLTFTDENYHTFISVMQDGENYRGQRRSIETINMVGKILPELHPVAPPSARLDSLLGQIDASLVPAMRGLFSGIAHVDTYRSIPQSSSPHESHGITPDGSNILNELNNLTLEKRLEFNKFLKKMTDESISSIETAMNDDKLVLKAAEPGLDRKTPRADFSSGQEQLVLLALRLFTRPGTIFMLTEPELHLHAKAQKRVQLGLKTASSELQIIVETHSPTFLEADNDEAVYLITKAKGSSHVIPIGPDNLDMIRHELGVTHRDSLHHENILFVEGDSEHAAFPKFMSTLGCSAAARTAVFNLGGVGRIKHLQLLLSYFKVERRRVFVVLDDSEAAHKHTKKLVDDKLLGKNFFIFDKNFEDAFGSAAIVGAVKKMATEHECEFPLTAGDLDSERAAGTRVDVVLQERWKKATGRDFSKVALAKSLATLPSGGIPDEIKSALRAAATHFGQDGGGKPAKGYDAGLPIYGQEQEASIPHEFGASPKRVAEYIKGAPPPPRPKPAQLGQAAKQLLDDRGILSEKSAGFARNKHFGRLYIGGLTDVEKPVILFTACPHKFGKHDDVATAGFEEWAVDTVRFDMRGGHLTGRELYAEIDIGSLIVIERQPHEQPRQDIRSYHEFHDNGFFEHGTSFSYVVRNRQGEASLHLCSLIGNFWSFLLHTRRFYQKISMEGSFTVLLSVRNSSKLALGNYGDEMASHKRLCTPTSLLGHEPRTQRRHMRLLHAFASVHEMTDQAIAGAAREMARKICSVYGQDAPKCYSSDGEFAWKLWERVSR